MSLWKEIGQGQELVLGARVQILVDTQRRRSLDHSHGHHSNEGPRTASHSRCLVGTANAMNHGMTKVARYLGRGSLIHSCSTDADAVVQDLNVAMYEPCAVASWCESEWGEKCST